MKLEDLRNMPIGFFDSGVGGLSVMRKAIELLPKENLIYYGDSLNAPYGVKSVEEAKRLTFNAVEFLLDKKAKAIVIACNTATSVAIKDLRSKYKDIPIIGIEPAVKPAVEHHKRGKVVIMATQLTLSEDKFNNLLNTCNQEVDIVPMPCSGLVEFVEKGILEGNELKEFLENKFRPYKDDIIETIVLGCTHYPFIKETLRKIVGPSVNIIDGSEGTVRQLIRKLDEKSLLKEEDGRKIEIYNSLNTKEVIDLSYSLIK
ncbi:glutamate racemase [Inconstantimicrobium mannanitabidum]|uniref:Glutamate racemase n=1 Tax=Inconstantimicrobium mannanitabidum TaxID=1604901 RepID=A0ACB5RHS3_9CLOT|nr:glutamate racemase [Clostridium sp. TW13]GKX68645.1 glutamate racemase [Clostridium sp. TW13]